MIQHQYVDSERTFVHVQALLRLYPSFQPRIDPFQHPDGTSNRMLCIQGTLPIDFRLQIYHIPLEMWLPSPYPFTAPYVYVKPTLTMSLATSEHVDANGRVALHYLQYWDHTKSDLTQLATALQHLFSLKPPVYAKSPESSPSPHGIMNASVPSTLPPALQPGTMRVAQQRARLAGQLESQVPPLKAALDTELASLRHESEKLGTRYARLQAVVGRLKERKALIEQTIEGLDAAIEKLSASTRGMPLIRSQNTLLLSTKGDGLLIPKTPLQAQFLKAKAEDRAIEDTMYILGLGLEKGRIDCQAFLKHLRALAREQFFARTIIEQAQRRFA